MCPEGPTIILVLYWWASLRDINSSYAFRIEEFRSKISNSIIIVAPILLLQFEYNLELGNKHWWESPFYEIVKISQYTGGVWIFYYKYHHSKRFEGDSSKKKDIKRKEFIRLKKSDCHQSRTHAWTYVRTISSWNPTDHYKNRGPWLGNCERNIII